MNSKEMLTKWYAWRAMLFELCHLSRIIEFFRRLRYCAESFLARVTPDWTDQKFLFSFMTTVLSIEILIALWSIQQSMMWQILNKNLLCDSQNRAIV